MLELAGVLAAGSIANSCVISAKSWSTAGKGNAGVNDEQTNHANGFLHGKMGVIKVRARLMQRDFIDPGLARHDRFLREKLDSVHRVGQFQAMQVERGRLGQFVMQHEAKLVPLGDLDGRTRHRTVESPVIDEAPGSNSRLTGCAKR